MSHATEAKRDGPPASGAVALWQPGAVEAAPGWPECPGGPVRVFTTFVPWWHTPFAHCAAVVFFVGGAIVAGLTAVLVLLAVAPMVSRVWPGHPLPVTSASTAGFYLVFAQMALHVCAVGRRMAAADLQALRGRRAVEVSPCGLVYRSPGLVVVAPWDAFSGAGRTISFLAGTDGLLLRRPVRLTRRGRAWAPPPRGVPLALIQPEWRTGELGDAN